LYEDEYGIYEIGIRNRGWDIEGIYLREWEINDNEYIRDDRWEWEWEYKWEWEIDDELYK